MNEYLEPGRFVDSTHPLVIAFAREHAAGVSEREKAVARHDSAKAEELKIEIAQVLACLDAVSESTPAL